MRGDLALRLRVAMLGSFGVSAKIAQWTAEERALAARHIALYRERLRSLIHHGDQYLLTPPLPADGDGDWAAIWYVAKDGLGGALFAFRLAGTEAARSFSLPGLRAERRYRVAFFGQAARERDGAALARGFRVAIPEMFRSELCLLGAA
jgi:alpha-galactosidase